MGVGGSGLGVAHARGLYSVHDIQRSWWTLARLLLGQGPAKHRGRRVLKRVAGALKQAQSLGHHHVVPLARRRCGCGRELLRAAIWLKRHNVAANLHLGGFFGVKGLDDVRDGPPGLRGGRAPCPARVHGGVQMSRTLLTADVGAVGSAG